MTTRTLTLLTLLFAGATAAADDSKIVGVYDLKGSYTDAGAASLADSTVKLTVTRTRGKLKFTRTSTIPAGPHRTLLPTSWESKSVRNRGTVSNDQGKYRVYEATYPVRVREARGARGVIAGDPTSSRLVTRDLTIHYYWPADDLTAVAELATNTIKHHSPKDWSTLQSFGNKTADAPIAPTTPTRPTTPVVPPSRFDASGFDRNGFDRNGFDRFGRDRNGYDRYGFDRYGFDRQGFDRNGFNRHGYNRAGFNRYGFDLYGYNRYGFDRYGFDRNGFDRHGFNRHGFNRAGFDRYGNHFRNRGFSRGYVPRSPSIVIGSPNNNVRFYSNGTSYYHHSRRSRSGAGFSINIPLGR